MKIPSFNLRKSVRVNKISIMYLLVVCLINFATACSASEAQNDSSAAFTSETPSTGFPLDLPLLVSPSKYESPLQMPAASD